MSNTATSTLTTTTTLVGTPSAMKDVMTLSEKQCPTCGGTGDSHGALESQRRIQELEGQVQALTERAAMTGKQEDNPEDSMLFDLRAHKALLERRRNFTLDKCIHAYVDLGMSLLTDSLPTSQPTSSPTTKTNCVVCVPLKPPITFHRASPLDPHPRRKPKRPSRQVKPSPRPMRRRKLHNIPTAAYPP